MTTQMRPAAQNKHFFNHIIQAYPAEELAAIAEDYGKNFSYQYREGDRGSSRVSDTG